MTKVNIVLAMIVVIILCFLIFITAPPKITGYTEYVVNKYDTVWSIAYENYNNKMDVRKIIVDIEKKNNIQNCLIYPGQVLLLPNYEKLGSDYFRFSIIQSTTIK